LIMAPGSDRRVSLFDAATGIRLGTPIEIADDEVSAASLSPYGSALAFGGGWDQPVKVMDLRPANWAAAACRLAGRELTAEEWQTNVGSLAEYHAVCPATSAS
jgi:WD40 repeat protein